MSAIPPAYGLPIVPNEEARAACMSALRVIRSQYRDGLTVAEAEQLLQAATVCLCHLLSRMDMDDIVTEFEAIAEWNAP